MEEGLGSAMRLVFTMLCVACKTRGPCSLNPVGLACMAHAAAPPPCATKLLEWSGSAYLFVSGLFTR